MRTTVLSKTALAKEWDFFQCSCHVFWVQHMFHSLSLSLDLGAVVPVNKGFEDVKNLLHRRLAPGFVKLVDKTLLVWRRHIRSCCRSRHRCVSIGMLGSVCWPISLGLPCPIPEKNKCHSRKGIVIWSRRMICWLCFRSPGFIYLNQGGVLCQVSTHWHRWVLLSGWSKSTWGYWRVI